MVYIASFLNSLIQILMVAIFGRVIMDWLVIAGVMQANNPLRHALFRITEPMLGLVRRYVRVGMLDLSPMVTVLVLAFIQRIIMSFV